MQWEHQSGNAVAGQVTDPCTGDKTLCKTTDDDWCALGEPEDRMEKKAGLKIPEGEACAARYKIIDCD